MAAIADLTPVRRLARVQLAADGSLKGTIDVDFNGNAALENRLSALTELRGFFGKVAAADQEQLVLRNTTATAEK